MALCRGCRLFAVVLLILGRSALAAEPVEVIDRANLAQRVQHLERIVEGQGLSKLLLRVERLQASLRQLRGKTEELQHRLNGLENRQRALYRDLDRRLQKLSQAQEKLTPRSTGEITDAAKAKLTAPVPGEKAYRAALELLKEGRYKEAITALERFPQRHPHSPYRANAQYWLAEAHYVLGDFEAAARSFQALAEQYPESVKVPDAKLKQGLAYYQLKQWEQAKARFQEVVARFPDSTASRLAEEYLDKIQREQRS